MKEELQPLDFRSVVFGPVQEGLCISEIIRIQRGSNSNQNVRNVVLIKEGDLPKLLEAIKERFGEQILKGEN